MPFEPRGRRQNFGPPAHLQACEEQSRIAAQLSARRAAYARAAAARAALEAARRLAPPSSIVLPPSTLIAPTRATSVPIIVPSPPICVQDRSRPVGQPARRRFNPFLVGLLGVPATGFVAALLLPAGRPATPPSAPTSLATVPLSPRAIEQRIAEMTPSLRYGAAGPAWPGSIRLAALHLPTVAPDVPSLARPATPLDVVVPTTPLRMPSLPPEIAVAGNDAVSPAAQCRPADTATVVQPTPPREAVGVALAAAALQQTSQFVVYDARYTRIAYPGGDVATLHGVCTDVVIRAYRSIGIDLQRLVHESRLGAGDTSIDHRRTETLRRFLATHGESLPVSDDAADYQPGDIVTYYRPQNRTSTAHIAVVSAEIAPSGRPMIIHNRGLGVQLEDALFVDRITGRYRYGGPPTPQVPVAVIAGAVRPTSSALPRAAAAIPAQTTAATTVVRAAARSPVTSRLGLRQTSGLAVVQSR